MRTYVSGAVGHVTARSHSTTETEQIEARTCVCTGTRQRNIRPWLPSRPGKRLALRLRKAGG